MRAVISPGFRPFAIGLLLVPVGSFGYPGFRPGPAPLSAQDARLMTVDDVLELKSLSQLSMSPDGRWVAYVVTGRDMEEDRQETDVWVVPAAGGPSDVRQLTFRPGSDDSPVWHPSGDWLAFSSDRDGERQVYGIQPDGGEAWQVTSHETSVGGFRFAPDGQRLGFTASPPPTDADGELEATRGRPIVWDSVYTDQWSHLYVAELEDDVADEAVRWCAGRPPCAGLRVVPRFASARVRRALVTRAADELLRGDLRAVGPGDRGPQRHLDAGR